VTSFIVDAGSIGRLPFHAISGSGSPTRSTTTLIADAGTFARCSATSTDAGRPAARAAGDTTTVLRASLWSFLRACAGGANASAVQAATTAAVRAHRRVRLTNRADRAEIGMGEYGKDTRLRAGRAAPERTL
jgi:hypothetical protein